MQQQQELVHMILPFIIFLIPLNLENAAKQIPLYRQIVQLPRFSIFFVGCVVPPYARLQTLLDCDYGRSPALSLCAASPLSLRSFPILRMFRMELLMECFIPEVVSVFEVVRVVEPILVHLFRFPLYRQIVQLPRFSIFFVDCVVPNDKRICTIATYCRMRRRSLTLSMQVELPLSDQQFLKMLIGQRQREQHISFPRFEIMSCKPLTKSKHGPMVTPQLNAALICHEMNKQMFVDLIKSRQEQSVVHMLGP